MTSRRSFLVALGACAVTPAVADRLLPDHFRREIMRRTAETLRGIAATLGRRLPYAAPRISGGFLVPPEYATELRDLVNCRCVLVPEPSRTPAPCMSVHGERRNAEGSAA